MTYSATLFASLGCSNTNYLSQSYFHGNVFSILSVLIIYHLDTRYFRIMVDWGLYPESPWSHHGVTGEDMNRQHTEVINSIGLVLIIVICLLLYDEFCLDYSKDKAVTVIQNKGKIFRKQGPFSVFDWSMSEYHTNIGSSFNGQDLDRSPINTVPIKPISFCHFTNVVSKK